MYSELIDKVKESAMSILPISIFILLLNFTVAKLEPGSIMLLGSGSLLLILGLGLFTLGSELALMPIGEIMGSALTASRKLWLLIGGSFLLGFLVTIAEPDLQVLTKQVPSIPDKVLIFTIAAGVGFFLVIAILRILLKIKLSLVFIIGYILLFVFAALGDQNYVAVAFDSGGVTTGPITVPFILALGAGVSAVNASSKNSEEDSFGLCAVCSIGPILSVLILGLFFPANGITRAAETVKEVTTFYEMLLAYNGSLKTFLGHVLLSLAPIGIVFYIAQIFVFKMPKRQVLKITVGLIYTFLGLTIFLTGANVGFLPVGSSLGKSIASLSYNWILVPISLIMGVLVIAAEPAVYALNKQIEEITSGAISRRTMFIGLAGGVGIALALSMIRIIFQFSVWYYILPGYTIALVLTFFVSPLFTSIAFDSGGVASGAMAAAFILPFSLGATEAVGGDLMISGFGIIAMIAMMPLISVQIVGLVYQIKLKKAEQDEEDTFVSEEEDLYDLDEETIETLDDESEIYIIHNVVNNEIESETITTQEEIKVESENITLEEEIDEEVDNVE